MSFDFQKIEDILVCPETHAPLVHDGGRLVSIDPDRRLSYPIIDDIPIMLVDEASEVPEDEWRAVMQRTGRDPVTGEKSGSSEPYAPESNAADA